jgi:Tfp pilus assembly pilus retraction ATPase PilT
MAGLHPAFRMDGKLRPLIEYGKFDPQTAKELIYSVLTEEQKVNFDVAEPYLKGYSKCEFQQLIKGGSTTEVDSEEKHYNQI